SSAVYALGSAGGFEMTTAPTLMLGEFHRFQAAREDFLYLVPSAALFRLDDQASAILNELSGGPLPGEELVAKLASRFPAPELMETIAELRNIRAIGEAGRRKESAPRQHPDESF